MTLVDCVGAEEDGKAEASQIASRVLVLVGKYCIASVSGVIVM